MDQVLNILGLAMRAGKIIDGEGRVLDSLKKHQSLYIFLASDAGDNIKKKIRDKTSYYHFPLNDSYDSQILSQAIGKENRRVIAVCDKGFIKLLQKA